MTILRDIPQIHMTEDKFDKPFILTKKRYLIRKLNPIRLFSWAIRRFSLFCCSRLEQISILDRRILKDDICNFHKVSDVLYRGGQPLGKGFHQLQEHGIKTIINLRVIDTDAPQVDPLELDYVHISFKPHLPKDADVINFLKIIHEAKNTPVYLHCYHGADRTGMLCAAYRIVFDGWEKDKAIKEMIHGGYGFHKFFQQNLIHYLKKMDVEYIKSKIGI